MPDLCAICRAKPGRVFQLRRNAPKPDGSGWTTVGAGSIVICLTCEEQVAAPKRRQRGQG